MTDLLNVEDLIRSGFSVLRRHCHLFLIYLLSRAGRVSQYRSAALKYTPTVASPSLDA